jgi:hypothetical protein
MNKAGAVCLRFDIDTFSTRHHFIADVGWGEFKYIPKILEIGRQFGITFQFCTCGQGLKEFGPDHQAIKAAGHAIDSHLYTHNVTLLDELPEIKHELELTEAEFARQSITWTGIGATGGYPDGIGHRADVVQLLTDRGYQWVSSIYDLDRGLADAQPFWLNSTLLEIPMKSLSDRHYFYDVDAPVHGFTRIMQLNLERAAERGLLFVVPLHPGVLAKFDPDCRFITTILERARQLGVPLVTMSQIRQEAQIA